MEIEIVPPESDDADGDGIISIDLDATYFPNPAEFNNALDAVMEHYDESLDEPHPHVLATHVYYASAFHPKVEPWREILGEELYWNMLSYVAPILEPLASAVNDYEESDVTDLLVTPHLVVLLCASLYGIIDEESDEAIDAYARAFDVFVEDLDFEHQMTIAPIADLLGRLRSRSPMDIDTPAEWKDELNQIMKIYALPVGRVAELWDNFADVTGTNEDGQATVEQINGIMDVDAYPELVVLAKDLPEPAATSQELIESYYLKLPPAFHEGLRLFWLREVKERYTPETTLVKKARAMWPGLRLVSTAFSEEQWTHLCQYLSSDLLVQKGYEILQDYYKHGIPHFSWAEIRTHVVSHLAVNLVRPELMDEWSKQLYGHPSLIDERPILLKMIGEHVAEFQHFPWYAGKFH